MINIVDYLRETFDYLPEGQLIRKEDGHVFKAHREDNLGYVYLKGGHNRSLSLNRAVWMWHNGPIPPKCHILPLNGKLHDSRIENLFLQEVRKPDKKVNKSSTISEEEAFKRLCELLGA